jgi:hypothetical protein
MSPPQPPSVPPFPADVVALIEHERRASPPPGMKVRVAARLGLATPAPWWAGPAAKTGIIVVAIAGAAATWLAARRGDAPAERGGPPPVAVIGRAPPVPPAIATIPLRTAARDQTVSPARPAARVGPPRGDSEVVLLRRARAALARHDAREALAVISRHRRRWPDGDLTQEREVLAIQALILDGSAAAARAHADRFLRRYPQSTLTATVQQLRASASGEEHFPP